MIQNNIEFLNGQKIEDIAVAWRWSENGGKHWFDWTADWGFWLKAKEMGCLIEYAIPAKEVLK
jgi:hypothetical protein